MIYTITLTPAIEKRVRGLMKDDILFEGEQFTYNSAGVGLKVSKYLNHYHIDNTAAFICGNKAASFLLEDLKERNIPEVHVETNAKTPYHLLVIDEKENAYDIDKEYQTIEDHQLKIFQSVFFPQMEENAVSVFEYNQNDLSYETMHDFYSALHKKSEVIICDIHPDYYSILDNQNANVLVLEEKQLLSYIKKAKCPLSDLIEMITKEFTNKAKIVIYAISANDFLLFVEGEIYRVVCSVKNPHAQIYKEALLAGIVKCYYEDGDLNTLSKECITMSVGAALSDGLFVPKDAVIEKIIKSMNTYRL